MVSFLLSVISCIAADFADIAKLIVRFLAEPEVTSARLHAVTLVGQVAVSGFPFVAPIGRSFCLCNYIKSVKRKCQSKLQLRA